MKIGYLLEQGVGIQERPFSGPANHVYHVVRGLEAQGHQIRLLTRDDDRIWKSDNLEDFKPVHVRGTDNGSWHLLEKATRRIQSLFRVPYLGYFEAERFARACQQELAGFDLLYQRNSWMGFGGGLAAQRMNIPLILEDNGDHIDDLSAKNEAPDGLQLSLAQTRMKKAMGRAAHVISSGEGWRRTFIWRWGYDPNRVTTIENGTELCDLLQRDQLYSFRKNAPSRQTVTLIYVGGFYPWHGISILLPALACARQQGVNARLILIGSGNGFAEAQKLTEELALTEIVTFTGQRKPEAYAPMLAEADIGVSPYCGWKEYSGLKILDYKAMGLPTIASGTDGMPPTLAHEQTGLIVPPCDENALSEAIVRLSRDADLRRRMGQQARLEAEQIHSWDFTATQIEKVFKQVLEQKA